LGVAVQRLRLLVLQTPLQLLAQQRADHCLEVKFCENRFNLFSV
jgi:hypothetical protein